MSKYDKLTDYFISCKEKYDIKLKAVNHISKSFQHFKEIINFSILYDVTLEQIRYVFFSAPIEELEKQYPDQVKGILKLCELYPNLISFNNELSKENIMVSKLRLEL